MEIKFPKILKKAIRKGYIISIIQFGSSLWNPKRQDIDLAIVLKRGCYKNFLKIVYGEKLQDFDISLIKEKEVQGPEKFRFGGHGAHFLFSLIQGKTLYGRNPFRRFKVSESQVKRSITWRLFDYIEEVRRALFRGKINKNIERRWPKFLRLSLYLLNSKLKYPDVLNLNKDETKKYLRKYHIDIDITSKNLKNPKNLLIAYETIWRKVLRKRRLIPPEKHS